MTTAETQIDVASATAGWRRQEVEQAFPRLPGLAEQCSPPPLDPSLAIQHGPAKENFFPTKHILFSA